MTEENAVVHVMHVALIVETMLPPQRPLTLSRRLQLSKQQLRSHLQKQTSSVPNAAPRFTATTYLLLLLHRLQVIDTPERDVVPKPGVFASNRHSTTHNA